MGSTILLYSFSLIRPDLIASILSEAPPLPPATIAPAWPILLPGGAVMPAINPAIGFALPFFLSSLINWAASSSAVPPISPIKTILSVSGSDKNNSRTSICSVPFIGSPPIPTHVDCPNPISVVWATAS